LAYFARNLLVFAIKAEFHTGMLTCVDNTPSMRVIDKR